MTPDPDDTPLSREDAALDALIVWAFRSDPIDDPDWEPDLENLPELSEKEKAAIDAHLGPDLIGRLLKQAREEE